MRVLVVEILVPDIEQAGVTSVAGFRWTR